MWIDELEEDYYIRKLYNDIPRLENVNIMNVEMKEEGERITIIFDMPVFPDNPPAKWKLSKYNTAQVKLDFFSIKSFSIRLSKEKVNNIEVYKNEVGNVIVNLMGKVEGMIEAEVGMIQSIEGYLGCVK